MTRTAQQLRAKPGRRPSQTAVLNWNAPRQPSQRDAATRRAAAQYQATVRRWLRDLAGH